MKATVCKNLFCVGCILVVSFFGGVASADCVCWGDVAGAGVGTAPNGYVNVVDIAECVNLINAYSQPGQWRVPASLEPCLDVADMNGQRLDGGDGWIDMGDIVSILESVNVQRKTPTIFLAECPLQIVETTTGGAELHIAVNGSPWDGVSPAAAGDIVTVHWLGTDTFEYYPNWVGGFCNFILHVSRGGYLNDLTISEDFSIFDLVVSPDGSGGFNVGAGAYSAGGSNTSPDEIFSFSFQIPDVSGPPYTIYIGPTQGSWRLIMYDQLPYVELPVSGQEPESITVLWPNGGEKLLSSTAHEIVWDSAGTFTEVAIDYSLDLGENWTPITGTADNDGNYLWDPVPVAYSQDCLVRIEDTGGSVSDSSDGPFTIFDCIIKPLLGDLNNDCYVNLPDVAILAQNWLLCGNPFDPACNEAADVDEDGYINADYGGDDCDDSDPNVYPGAMEMCDGKDNDCDGMIDNRDMDIDSFFDEACGGVDCDDANPNVNPGAVEICGNGLDDDCDGTIDNKDADADGYVDEACGGDDCDDANPNVNPGAVEICGNGLDDDCDGLTDNKDADSDGYIDIACGGDDCDDANPNVNPGAVEICDNGIDDDCDGDIDGDDSDCQATWPESWDWLYQCRGDANNAEAAGIRVNAADLTILSAALPSIYPNPNYNPAADFDRDGDVDPDDYAILMNNYGKPTSQLETCPAGGVWPPF